jgi:hypothetical protein
MPRSPAKQPDLFALQPTAASASSSSLTDAPAPQIALPSELSGSLGYLDDDQLARLREAVRLEVSRRNRLVPERKPGVSSSRDHRAVERGQGRETDEIPFGKVNLIQASFRAGLKPAAIARSLGVSQPLVRHVLRSVQKPES